MGQREKLKYREFEKGSVVYLTEEVVFDEIKIPAGTFGKIVEASNRVEAVIWFHDTWNYKVPFVKNHLQYDRHFYGVVLLVSATKFAVLYQRDVHDKVMVPKRELLDIPYLDLTKLTPYEARYYENNVKATEYLLSEIIDSIENNFYKFVDVLDSREATEDGVTELEYVFTDESMNAYHEEKHKILEPFMKATGIYYNFKGGAIED